MKKKRNKLPKSPVLPLFLSGIFGLFTPTAWALDLPNFWETMDKQAYDEFQKKHFEAAEDLFEDPVWHGVTLYKLGRYQEAINEFKKVKTPLSLYNLGNSYAQLGQFKMAEKAYQEALKLHPKPELKSKIEYNLKLMQKLLKKSSKQKQASQTATQSRPESKKKTDEQENKKSPKKPQPQNKDQVSAPESATQKGKQAEDENRSKQGKQSGQMDKADKKASPNTSSDSKASKNGSGDGQSSPSKGVQALDQKQKLKQGQAPQKAEKLKLGDQSSSTAKNAAHMQDGEKPENDQKNTEQTQAQQTWFNQIPDEPEQFIERKFEYQYQQQGQRPEPKKIW